MSEGLDHETSTGSDTEVPVIKKDYRVILGDTSSSPVRPRSRGVLSGCNRLVR